jgi:hypothetical protein
MIIKSKDINQKEMTIRMTEESWEKIAVLLQELRPSDNEELEEFLLSLNEHGIMSGQTYDKVYTDDDGWWFQYVIPF